MRYLHQPKALTEDIESHREEITQIGKSLRQPRWIRGHLFVTTVDSPSSDPPTEEISTGGEAGQESEAQPGFAAGVGISQPMPNGSFRHGDTIHYVEAPETLLAIRWSAHRPTEASEATGYVQVRVRDWIGEEWLGEMLSSLEEELGRGGDVEVNVDLEPGAEIGGVYARIGKGPAFHPRSGTLHLLIARR